MGVRTIVIAEADLRRLERLLASELATVIGPRSHLDELLAELQHATVVQPADIPEDVVTMNSTVRVRDLDTNEFETYTLVYPSEANIANSRLSITAPIGAAILGCRVGDVMRWRVPSGLRRMRIERVLYQPGREKAYHLKETE